MDSTIESNSYSNGIQENEMGVKLVSRNATIIPDPNTSYTKQMTGKSVARIQGLPRPFANGNLVAVSTSQFICYVVRGIYFLFSLRKRLTLTRCNDSCNWNQNWEN